MRSRLGLPARATERAAANALVRGIKRTKFSGNLRRYLDALYHKGKRENSAQNIIVYGDVVYLFAGDILVTTWPLPSRFRGYKRKNNAEVSDREGEEGDQGIRS